MKNSCMPQTQILSVFLSIFVNRFPLLALISVNHIPSLYQIQKQKQKEDVHIVNHFTVGQ